MKELTRQYLSDASERLDAGIATVQALKPAWYEQGGKAFVDFVSLMELQIRAALFIQDHGPKSEGKP